MRNLDLAHEFDRFRRDGDVAALARIFDDVAPDLLRLAKALARDCELPEDLVQATFLTAIESRDGFDASRPLEPWLAGILAHHVSNARRRASRHGKPTFNDDDARSPERELGIADDRVIEREVWTTISKAIAELPPNYREVVAPRLLRGERATEIARRVGAPAGAVRMRLQRGIALLRRMLPRGITAAFTGFVLSRSSRAALANSRVEILANASSCFGTAPTIVVPTGAFLVTKKILLALATVALVAVGYVLTHHDDLEEHDSPSMTVDAPRIDDPPRPLAADDAPADSERTALSVPASATKANVVAVPDSYARALAGITGRILESDRTPVRNTPLTLIEIDPNSWIADLADTFRDVTIDPFVAEARTDSDGRFLITGIYPRGIHGLGIDLGGPRATLRMIDLPLPSGTVVELGDIVLGSRGRLTGTIVDEEGRAVPNARVRGACLPAVFARIGIERLNETTRILELQEHDSWVLELPNFVRRALARLPIPTTRTDTDGRFCLEGVPSGSVTLLVDHPKFVARAFGPRSIVATSAGDPKTTRQDIGSIELSSGRTVTGRVVDARGKPLPNAIVVGGTDIGVGAVMFSSANPILTNAECVTDSQGRFTLEAIPEEGRAVYAARSAELARWTTLASEDDEVEIVMSDSIEHELHVERADGVPVELIELRVGAARATNTGLETSATFVDITRSIESRGSGEFIIAGLAPGAYRALLRCAPVPNRPLGPFSFEFVISPEVRQTKVEIPVARRLEVRVREAGAQSAVEHASVAVLSDTATDEADEFDAITLGTAITQSRTDRRGITILDGIAVDPRTMLRLRVDHPSHGAASVLVEPSATSVDVVLSTPGSFLGHLRLLGAVPRERYTAMVLPQAWPSESADAFVLPHLSNSNAAGEIQLSALAPGTYEIQTSTDFLSQDLGTLVARAATDMRQLEPEIVALSSFQITSGQRTEITIDLAPHDSPSSATLSGSVTESGKPLEYAMLIITPNPTRKVIEVDASGRYEMKDLAPGKYRVDLYDGVKLGDSVSLQSRASESVELHAGEHRTLDFKFESIQFKVHVERTGSPVANATVELIPLKPAPATSGAPANNIVDPVLGSTNVDGDALVRIAYASTYDVTAHHPELGFVKRRIDLRADGNDPTLTLELEPGITLEASFDLDPRFDDTGSEYAISITPQHGFHGFSRTIPIDAGQRILRSEGIPSGMLEVTLSRLKRSNLGEFWQVVSQTISIDTRTQGIHLSFVPESP